MTDSLEAPALVQRGRLGTPVATSKLRVPAVPARAVRRTRLLALLDDLAAYPVVAVAAPAGAGKSTLAADWVRHRAGPTAWVCLDDADRDPAQLGASLVAAFDRLVPGVGDRATALVADPDGPQEALRALADDLDLAEPCEGVLVVDDLHRIDDSPAADAFAAFVEHRPAWLHLLLLGRRRPPLAVDRLRASGALADLSFDALRFSDAEAVAMLAGLCPEVPADALSAIATWSGGWAAALQLAALSVRSGRGTLPAQDRLVDSYVWHEVLRTERPELVGLLVSTAVVDRMSFGLAEALTGRPDAGDLLLEAEERGLFVTSLDAGGWFEVHGLVREMLLAELARRWPERLREQHARAARWHEDSGDGLAALEHWLAAERPEEALRLLAALAVPLGDAGRGTVVDRVLARVPPEVAVADPELLAWCRMPVDRAGFSDALHLLGDSPGSARAAVLQAAAADLRGDWRECLRRTRAALGDAPGRVDPVTGHGWRLLARAVALQEAWTESEAVLAEARAAVSADGGRRLAHETARAVGLALAGQPVDAVRVAGGVRTAVETAGLAALSLELDLAEAVAARELGDREAAERSLEALTGHAHHPHTWVSFLAGLELAEARLDVGDLPGAVGRLREATEVAERELPGADARARAARTGVLVALASDDLPAAETWVRRCDDPFWGPVSQARVHLRAGRRDEAAEAVQRAEPRCVRHQVVRDLVLARATVDTDRPVALKAVDGAVDLAAGSGLLQTVAAEGPVVVELVELAAWRAPEAWLGRLRRALAPEPVVARPAALVDDLTERERDVLRLLPSRLTLREIAGELYVSQNTLKFHLRVIYRKLGVNSRAEAVEAARALQLLRR